MITISGGVISKQDGFSISYKLKCDKCGHTESSEYRIIVSMGITEVSTKKCPNCGNNQMIKMRHLIEGQKAIARIITNS